MSVDARINFGLSAIAVAPAPPGSGLALTLEAGGGTQFASICPFNAVCWPPGVSPSKANAEIVRVESISGDKLALLGRGQESTSAQQIEPGWQFADMLTAKTIEDLKVMIEAEIARAETAEASIGSAAAGEIAVERARAEAAEAANANAVSTETTRAETEEGVLATNIAAEVSARKTAVTAAEAQAAVEAKSAEEAAIANAAAKAKVAEENATATATTKVATETTRAETAEAGKLAKANNLSDVTDAGTSRANVHVPMLTPALAVATTNVTTLSGLQAIDGVTPGSGAEELKTVLLTAQTEGKNNGLWNQATGAWTRPTELAEALAIKARTIAVVSGTVYAKSEWLLKTTGTITVGTTAQTWELLLPSSAETTSLKALGNISGVHATSFATPGVFTATLTGAAEIEATELPASPPRSYLLKVKPEGFTLSIKGLTEWIGPEPTSLLLGKSGPYALSLIAVEGKLYALAGIEGPAGAAGSNGNTVRSGKGAPEAGLGNLGDFYINTEADTIYGPKTGGGWGSASSLRGEKGERGEPGTSAAGESNESSFGFVVPVWAGGRWIPTAVAGIGTANRAVYNLIRLPKKGTLHEVVVWNGGTVNGEHNVAVIDTGQSKAGEYTVLWESKGVKAEGENKWQSLGEPGLGVEEVGRHLFLAIMNSGTTHTFGVQPEAISNAAPLLPAGFAIPRLMGAHTFGSLSYGGAGARIEESKLEAFQKAIVIAARIA
jgi:hypothetical protein